MESEHFKQFMVLYDSLRSRAQATWVFGLFQNKIVGFPKFDNYPVSFKPLFELAALEINKGLTPEKWDIVLGSIRLIDE